MSSLFRAFFAIKLDTPFKDYIRIIQNDLIHCCKGVKWVNPSNSHLTIKFLGNITESQINDISRAASIICSNQPWFKINTGAIEAYPQNKYARIIWLTIESNCITNQFALDLNEALTPLGFEKESRSFKAHITIARIRPNNENPPSLIQIENVKLKKQMAQTVKNICLFKSTLMPNGPIYESLATFPLKSP